MKVLVTGATGFIGSHIVPELISTGHHVIGLSRSDSGAQTLRNAGAEVFRGDVNDLSRLREAVAKAEGVIHAAFNHDFSKLKESSENDRNVVETLGEALSGSDRPLIVTSGTGMVRSNSNTVATEEDGHISSAEFARAATEEAADALIKSGRHVIIMRLPQVHDTRHQGRIAQHIQIARQKGRVAYIGEGKNRLPAAHVTDVAKAFRLALEKGKAGDRFHAAAEEGVPMREIAAALGAGLRLPVEAITQEDAKEYFGWLANLAAVDLAASGERTQRELGWQPIGADLLTDLKNTDFGQA